MLDGSPSMACSACVLSLDQLRQPSHKAAHRQLRVSFLGEITGRFYFVPYQLLHERKNSFSQPRIGYRAEGLDEAKRINTGNERFKPHHVRCVVCLKRWGYGVLRKKSLDWHTKLPRYIEKTSGAHTVDASFVFLDLLEGDAEFFRKIGLRKPTADTV